MSKSYWMGVTAHTKRHRATIMSWFGGVCTDMTVESAQILCDKETGREKKIKAVMVDKDGKRHVATRTIGGKTYTISLSPLKQKAA